MKKFIVAILAFSYLVTSIGATIHLHYCMDKLVDWSLSERTGDSCENCGMEEVGGCCKDERHFIKNNTDQKCAQFDMPLFQISAIAAPAPFIAPSELSLSQKAKYPTSHAPPGSSVPDILILNCVFRI